MSTAKQANAKPTTNSHAAPTDTAHRAQKDDPAEDDNIQNGRLPKDRTGHGDTHGRGVDEVGKDKKVPG